MATSSKAGAQRKSAARRNTDPRDEREPATMSEADSPRETRPVPSISARDEPQPETSQPEVTEDETATVLQQSVRPEMSSRPRKNTLATAITRPARDDTPPAATPPQGAETAPDDTPSPPPVAASLPAGEVSAEADEVCADIADEVDEDEIDEWAAADQPTIYLAPRSQAPSRPAYLDTGAEPSWPARPARAEPPAERPQRSFSPAPPPPDERRPAAPADPAMPGTPPAGMPRAALPNPRMQRFQELRERRMASDGHERLHQESRPVAEMVRKWWGDLLPGLEGALRYQREAKASGVHPIPAHAPTPTSRLGDAFGRFAASARDLTGRAQAAAAPALKRLHAQAEHATQALVEKIEGSPAQQQLPLLGPGRIAIFFKQGVTVGQAQKLLSASQARPIRLIPRKHGFLSLVPPGMEAEVAERLRVHPYVRDVAYLTYDEYGQPVLPPKR